jgi:hypothetical protein
MLFRTVTQQRVVLSVCLWVGLHACRRLYPHGALCYVLGMTRHRNFPAPLHLHIPELHVGHLGSINLNVPQLSDV